MNRNEIIQGDALEVLRTLPDGIVQTTVTSPPYWGLRDYGVPGQLGLEATPEEHVAKMVEIFREVRRVTRDDGTLWLNYGDSYTSGGRDSYGGNDPHCKQATHSAIKDAKRAPQPSNLKPKDLCGIPWRVAFALQADGWYLRSDIIWHKPNPMPESCKDRPTKSHEYLFLMSKQPRYYWDAEAVREPHNSYLPMSHFSRRGNHPKKLDSSSRSTFPMDGPREYNPAGRNIRDVWTIPTAPYSEAHFATFPIKLVTPCVLAGSPPKCCGVCGTPWVRVVERGNLVGRDRGGNYKGRESDVDLAGGNRMESKNDYHPGMSYETKTLGWRSGCEHDDDSGRSIVMDPFAGSGTVPFVAENHNRDYLGIELNPEYIAMAKRRLRQGVLAL